MSLYKYKAYNKTGGIETGFLYAERESQIVDFLSKLNLIPIKIKRVRYRFLLKFYNFFVRRISLNEKIYLARDLYLILKSGLNLSQGLDILISESKGGLRYFLMYLKYSLEKGEPFYRAFMSFSESFSAIEIEMIRAGEVAGTLQKNLLRWAENLERTRDVRREVVSDLIYPIIVLGMAFGVFGFLILFVLPRIAQLLEQLTQQPPFLTRVILDFSSFVRSNLTIIIYSIIFIISALSIFFVSKIGKKFIRNLLIRLPIFKTMYLYLSLSDSLFIIQSLTESGVHLTDAFRLTANAISHPHLKEAFLRIEKYIKTGTTLPEALKREKVIPSLLANILGIASESGSLVEVLSIMEDFYRTEARLKMKTLLNLMEPVLLIFLGIIVALVAVSVIVPIYQQISRQLELQKERQQMF